MIWNRADSKGATDAVPSVIPAPSRPVRVPSRPSGSIRNRCIRWKPWSSGPTYRPACAPRLRAPSSGTTLPAPRSRPWPSKSIRCGRRKCRAGRGRTAASATAASSTRNPAAAAAAAAAGAAAVAAPDWAESSSRIIRSNRPPSKAPLPAGWAADSR